MTVTTTERAEIRELARSVARDRVAPYAAEVDESAQFPKESYRALVEAQLHAVVIPEEYGGVSADALTGVVVAEEIARVCASTQQVSAPTTCSPGRCCSRLTRAAAAVAEPDRRRSRLGRVRAVRTGGRQRCRVAVDPCRAAPARSPVTTPRIWASAIRRQHSSSTGSTWQGWA
jgi:alkylation response protein AidB-like acyl-CoA dehydrogenase